jgi:hypothetical protein
VCQGTHTEVVFPEEKVILRRAPDPKSGARVAESDSNTMYWIYAFPPPSLELIATGVTYSFHIR